MLVRWFEAADQTISPPGSLTSKQVFRKTQLKHLQFISTTTEQYPSAEEEPVTRSKAPEEHFEPRGETVLSTAVKDEL